MTETGAFLDGSRPPSTEELTAALGTAAARWTGLVEWLGATYGVEGEPLFFGRDSGWCLRFRRSGRALLTLLPHEGGFRVLVVVGPSVAAGVEAAVAAGDLGRPIAEAFADATAYPDGRWLWLPVDDEAAVEDVRRLVALKSPPPKRPRPRLVGA
jgi:hypothetical protein